MREERLFGLVWLALCAGMAWIAWGIEVPFSYEPVGPRAFPLILAGLMAVCALALVLRPAAIGFGWPHGTVRAHLLIAIAALFAYAFLFEPLGFPLSTALLTVALGRVFGGSWKACVIGGLAMGGLMYLFFDRLLDVVLPLGSLFAAAGV